MTVGRVPHMRDSQVSAARALGEQTLAGAHRCFILGGMGSGKTRVACAALKAALAPGERVLIVSTPAVITQWPAELEAWGIPHTRYVRGERPTGVVLITFGELANAVTRARGAKKWTVAFPLPGTLIVDESRKLAGMRHRGGSAQGKAALVVSFAATRLWLMTANPVIDSITDAWAQMYFIDQGRALGSTLGAFLDRFCHFAPGDRDKYSPIANPGAAAEIGAVVRAHAVSVESRADVRESVVRVVDTPLCEAARAAYVSVQRTGMLRGYGVSGAAHKYAVLHQLASGAAYDLRVTDTDTDTGTDTDTDTDAGAGAGAESQSGPRKVHTFCNAKIDALRAIVQTLAGENILVSYVYDFQRAAIQRAFPQAVLMRATGGAVERWNAGGIKLGVVHARSLGHGMNLQHGGRTLVVYSENFSADAHTQMLERLGPQRQAASGYDREVYIYYLRAPGTVDTTVADVRDGKLSMADACR
jgi:hypothetical protein